MQWNRIGYDEMKHGFINPYEDVIQDQIPKRISKRKSNL